MPRRSTFHPNFVLFSSSPSRLTSLNPPPPLCYRDELLCAQPVRYFRLLRGNVLVFLIQKIACCNPTQAGWISPCISVFNSTRCVVVIHCPHLCRCNLKELRARASRPVLAVSGPRPDTLPSTVADREFLAETNCCVPNELIVASPLFSVSARATLSTPSTVVTTVQRTRPSF